MIRAAPLWICFALGLLAACGIKGDPVPPREAPGVDAATADAPPPDADPTPENPAP